MKYGAVESQFTNDITAQYVATENEHHKMAAPYLLAVIVKWCGSCQSKFVTDWISLSQRIVLYLKTGCTDNYIVYKYKCIYVFL